MGEGEEVLRLSGKLQRAVERTRRSAIKFLDNDSALAHTADIQALLETFADILEHALKSVSDPFKFWLSPNQQCNVETNSRRRYRRAGHPVCSGADQAKSP
jgi:hypothetical protein